MQSGNDKRDLFSGRQRCERIDNVDDKDVGRQDDEVHQQTDAHEVAEAVAARTMAISFLRNSKSGAP